MAQSVAVRRDMARLTQLAAPETYQKFHFPTMDGGIRTDRSPTLVAPNELTEVNNLTVLARRLTAAKGYSRFGPPIPNPQTAFQAFYPDGTSDTLLVTLDSVYRYEQAVNQWQYLSW